MQTELIELIDRNIIITQLYSPTQCNNNPFTTSKRITEYQPVGTFLWNIIQWPDVVRSLEVTVHIKNNNA